MKRLLATLADLPGPRIVLSQVLPAHQATERVGLQPGPSQHPGSEYSGNAFIEEW